MTPTEFVFRAIAISFWQRPPTSKGKPQHWERLARMAGTLLEQRQQEQQPQQTLHHRSKEIGRVSLTQPKHWLAGSGPGTNNF